MNPRVIALLEDQSVLISRVGVLLILLCGVAYSLLLGDTLRYVDERDYVEIAQTLVDEGKFAQTNGAPTAYRPPGYPFFLAGLIGFGMPIEILRICNFFLLAFGAVLLSNVASTAGERISAALIPFLPLAYPLVLYTAGTLYPQILCGFLLCAFLYSIFCIRRLAVRRVVAGCALGLSILTVPLTLLLLPILVLWSAVTRGVSFKEMIIACISAGLVTLPWLGRNHVVFEAFPLFGTNSGINLLLGNSEHTTPNSGVQADISEYLESAKDIRGEVSRNAFFREQAIENVAENPQRYAVLYAQKFLNWFNVNPNLATEGEQNSFQVAVLAISYSVLMGLIVFRLLILRVKPMMPSEALSLLLYVSAAAVYAVFFTRIRFRVPFDLLLALPAAQAVGFLIEKAAKKYV